ASINVKGQTITLYEQFNGRYDFVAIGNTMNLMENNVIGAPCNILTSSSADLNLDPDQTVITAYLYWPGSGSLDPPYHYPADDEVELNGIPITPDRIFEAIPDPNSQINLHFFGAFKDVTDIVQATGNGTYTLSEFDLSPIIQTYCNSTVNFGGWSIIVIY